MIMMMMMMMIIIMMMMMITSKGSHYNDDISNIIRTKDHSKSCQNLSWLLAGWHNLDQSTDICPGPLWRFPLNTSSYFSEKGGRQLNSWDPCDCSVLVLSGGLGVLQSVKLSYCIRRDSHFHLFSSFSQSSFSQFETDGTQGTTYSTLTWWWWINILKMMNLVKVGPMKIFPWEAQTMKEKNQIGATNVSMHPLWKAAWTVILKSTAEKS